MKLEKKKTIDHGDFYTTECILDFVQFRKNYKTIAVGLSKDSLYIYADPSVIDGEKIKLFVSVYNLVFYMQVYQETNWNVRVLFVM